MNRKHSESRSIADVEADPGEAVGARNHSTGWSPDWGRRGGGYVVGNAWEGAQVDESIQDSYCRLVYM